MDLKMFLAGQLIDTVRMNTYQLNLPGYIQGLKMEMEERNEDILDLSDEEPTFFIETVPSSMNLKQFQRMN
jgi:hypothetical protein